MRLSSDFHTGPQVGEWYLSEDRWKLKFTNQLDKWIWNFFPSLQEQYFGVIEVSLIYRLCEYLHHTY